MFLACFGVKRIHAIFIKNYSSFTSKSSMLTYIDVCDDISTFVFMYFL